MNTSKRILAPAKVNLCLHVHRKRDDGYHDLGMLMQRVALFDHIQISLVDGRQISVECTGLKLKKGEENIVDKAIRLMLDHVNIKTQGVAVSIDKSIPVAAGLGGGSSDAAAVIEALNDLLELDLPIAELMSLGRRLGADVPFFLYKNTAWATGIGDQFVSWPGLPPLWLLLVNPGFAVSTAWVFQNLGLTGQRPIAKLPKFPQGVRALACLLHNDLEAVTSQRYPVIKTIKERLVGSGAEGALMSGSGPTVLGLYKERCRAELAAKELSENTGWWVKVVSPL